MSCPICKCEPDAITRHFATSPFLDGRNYEFICHTCASVPKMWELIGDEYIVYDHQSPDRLNTVSDMVSDGWDANRAAISIKAINKLLKNRRIIVQYIDKQHVFAQLFLEDGPIMKIPKSEISHC